jgi:hypothetical protein
VVVHDVDDDLALVTQEVLADVGVGRTTQAGQRTQVSAPKKSITARNS